MTDLRAKGHRASAAPAAREGQTESSKRAREQWLLISIEPYASFHWGAGGRLCHCQGHYAKNKLRILCIDVRMSTKSSAVQRLFIKRTSSEIRPPQEMSFTLYNVMVTSQVSDKCHPVPRAEILSGEVWFMPEYLNVAVGSQVACEMSQCAICTPRERSATMLETLGSPRDLSPRTFICFLVAWGGRGTVRRKDKDW